MRIAIFDPAEEARALAFHMGREAGERRRPKLTRAEAADELRTAEVECLMTQTPNGAPIRSVTA